MPKAKRRAAELFGTSLLDMMTCSLGAVMLLMVLKRAAGTVEQIRLERDSAFKAQVAESLEARKTGAIQWADQALVDLRSDAKGALYGIPPAAGDLVIVFDCSKPMVAFGGRKRSVAIAAAQSVVGSWSKLENVAVVRFADTPESLYAGDFQPIGGQGNPARGQLTEAIGSTDGFAVVKGERSNAGAAMELAMKLLEGRPAGGTILLIADAVAAEGLGESLPQLQSAGEKISKRGGRISVHAIAVADWPANTMSDAQALEVLKARAELGSLERDKARVVRAAASLSSAAQQLRLRDSSVLRRDAEPRIADNASLAEDLRRITQRFGGRMVVYPVVPTNER